MRRYLIMVQKVEQWIENPLATGSISVKTPNFKGDEYNIHPFFIVKYIVKNKRKQMQVNVSQTEDGYLNNFEDWTPEIAKEIAKSEEIELTESHWEVINVLREYYIEHYFTPGTRVLTKVMQKKISKEKFNRAYLFSLFQYSPSKQASKISGLPRPSACSM